MPIVWNFQHFKNFTKVSLRFHSMHALFRRPFHCDLLFLKTWRKACHFILCSPDRYWRHQFVPFSQRAPGLTSSDRRLVMSGSATYFFHERPLQHKSEYIFVHNVSLFLAKLGPHLVLNGSDYRVRHRHARRRLHTPRHSPRALCADDFSCSYLTQAHDNDIDHDVPYHGYLDQGCTIQRSRVPHHQHKGL
jgi:hypothetical protein